MKNLKKIVSDLIALPGIILIALGAALLIDTMDKMSYQVVHLPEAKTTNYIIQSVHVWPMPSDSVSFKAGIKMRDTKNRGCR